MPRLAMSPFSAPGEASVAQIAQRLALEPGPAVVSSLRSAANRTSRSSGARSSWASLWTFVLVLCFAAGLAQAQIDSGSITGTVRDHTGALVSGAKVTITNEATNVSANTVTNSTGEYVAASLKVGTYTVTVEQPGFQKSVHSGIVLNVQDRKQVDATMELGAVTQQINVAGDVPLLQTETAGVGQVVTSQTIVDLPLNGRLYDQLALLVPGVTVDTPRQQGRGEGVFDVNGNWGTQNNFILDGVDNNSFSESLRKAALRWLFPRLIPYPNSGCRRAPTMPSLAATRDRW
jgi:hypothetical protein